MTIRIPLLALALLAGVAASSSAQAFQSYPQGQVRSKTTGVALAVSLNGSAIQVEDSQEAESGSGLSVRIGYGLSNRFELYAEGTGASIQYADFDGTYGLGHFDLGGRYHFRPAAEAVRPFVNAALGGRSVNMETEFGTVEARGAGITFGGGLGYFFTAPLALEVGLELMFGDFSQTRVENGPWEDLNEQSFGATSSRFNLGLAWRP